MPLKTLKYTLSLVKPEFATSQKGKRLIKMGAYTFRLQGVTHDRARWCCSTHNSKGCNAAVHTINDQLVHIKNVHNH
ncbi:hypothetical protein JYU34_004404 [Plutella xylostella]|uniref:FLYWCH-type domain-containing protein n=1 Tax=Plutella xylostella TaxID=51655 RepID=A0ABQ7QXW0_PLUXY|nr:hypothetical protein JYU34_004404 [Plutella xylostella]